MNCPQCGSPLSSLSSSCSSCGAAGGAGATGFVRPGLISLIAVLQFGGAGMLLFVAAAYIVLDATGDAPPAALILAALCGAGGAFQLACGIGLWRLRSWGRTLALVSSWVGLIGFPVGTAVSALMLYYLYRPGIKLMFSGRAFGSLTPEEREQVAAVSGSSRTVVIAIVALLVLCVVAVLGIIAAIAVPSLIRAKVAANETSAVMSLQAVHGAQLVYSAACGGGYYAPSLARLGIPPDGGSTFVLPDLAVDPARKGGYTFVLTPGPAVAEAPASCNGVAAGALVRSYFISAAPTDVPGGKFFGVNQDGTIYESASAMPVTQSGAPSGGVPLR